MTQNPNKTRYVDHLQDREDLERVIEKAQNDIWKIFHPHPAIKPAAKLDLQPLDIPTEPFVIRNTLTPKPAKDPNRARPAHKLGLNPGDTVMVRRWQDGSDAFIGETILVGSGNSLDKWLQTNIADPLPKGKRPLFEVLLRLTWSQA